MNCFIIFSLLLHLLPFLTFSPSNILPFITNNLGHFYYYCFKLFDGVTKIGTVDHSRILLSEPDDRRGHLGGP